MYGNGELKKSVTQTSRDGDINFGLFNYAELDSGNKMNLPTLDQSLYHCKKFEGQVGFVDYRAMERIPHQFEPPIKVKGWNVAYNQRKGEIQLILNELEYAGRDD